MDLLFFTQDNQVDLKAFLMQLAICAVLAALLGWVYRRFGRSLSNRESFASNFVLIALRYGFVSAILNGTPQPLYALEENFEKWLLENNQRREGPHRGTIRNSRFIKPGNDGVDTFGSMVTLEKIVVVDAGDKALSFGENSVINVDGLIVRGGSLGIAAKDESRVSVQFGAFEGTEIVAAAYQKKSEFGPASLEFSDMAPGVDLKSLLVEKGSTINWQGKILSGTYENLAKRLSR